MDVFKLFLDAFSKQNFFNFNGRTRRRNFGSFMLASILINITLELLQNVSGDLRLVFLSNVFLSMSIIFSLIVFIPSLSITTRRLHDLGHSGRWLVVIFVAGFLIAFMTGLGNLVFTILVLLYLIVLLIFYLYLTFKDGQKQPNKYGESTKYHNIIPPQTELAEKE